MPPPGCDTSVRNGKILRLGSKNPVCPRACLLYRNLYHLGYGLTEERAERVPIGSKKQKGNQP